MTTVWLVPTSVLGDDIKCPYCGAGYQFDTDCEFWGQDGQINEHECVKCGKTFKYKVVIIPEQYKAELVE
jgi:uncharacterized Zn-finger protein